MATKNNYIEANLFYFEEVINNVGDMQKQKVRAKGKLNLDTGEFILNKFIMVKNSQLEFKLNDELHIVDLKYISGKYFSDKNYPLIANMNLAYLLKDNLPDTYSVKKNKI